MTLFDMFCNIHVHVAGGGLGGTRKGGPDVNTKYSGRDDNFMNRWGTALYTVDECLSLKELHILVKSSF